MSLYHLQLTPRDLLFLRDARPMSAADAGSGANWPRPDQLWNALIHHFHRLWPERQPWEGAAHTKTAAEINSGRFSSDRFGALLTFGPFPMVKGKLFLPCPLDLAAQDHGELLPMSLTAAAGTNLPPPLQYALSTPVLGKQSPPAWIAADDFARYLQGKPFKPETIPCYDREYHIGIAMDPTTGATIDKQFYQAEYLRLREEVSLVFQASCTIKPKGESQTLVDVFAKMGLPHMIRLGGQQGVAALTEQAWNLPPAPCPDQIDAPCFLRWTLLSPALFPKIAPHPERNPHGHPGGWLPNWIDPVNGAVLLPAPGDGMERRPHENREVWRERRRQQGRVAARLVAARIGKPLYFSGWDLHQKGEPGAEAGDSQGAKPTQAAVPAGSVYLFACETPQAARDLWLTLNACAPNGRIVRQATAFGSKGFGIGVCSVFPKNQH